MGDPVSPVTPYDGSTSWDGSGFSSTESYIAASADMLVLRIIGDDSTPSSVTYDGVALTERVAIVDGNTAKSRIWDLASPASGANDIVITSVSGASFLVVVCTLDSVDLVTPGRNVASSNGWISSVSNAVVSTVDAIVLDVISVVDTVLATADEDQAETTTAEAAKTGVIAYTSEKVATTTSTTMSWSMDDANRVSHVAISYNAGAATAPTITGPPTAIEGTPSNGVGSGLGSVTTVTLKAGGRTLALAHGLIS